MSGGRTEGQATPSIYDIQRSEFSNEMIPYLRRYLESNFKGTPTAGQMQGTQQAIQEMRRSAGVTGLQPGDPRFFENSRMLTEGLTKPNQDAIQLAMQLYSGAPQMPGNQYQKYHPGGMDWASMIIGLIGSIYGKNASTTQYAGAKGQQYPDRGGLA